jgi:hypothetical protein
MTTNPAILSGGAVNRLKVLREFGQVTVFNNDQMLAVTPNVIYYPFHDVGIYAQSKSTVPYTVRFDNFQIWQWLSPSHTAVIEATHLPESKPFSQTAYPAWRG